MKTRNVIALLLWAPVVFAQGPLKLDEAVATALKRHPSIEAALAKVKASESRIEQARSAWLPTVNYQESVQRGNNPVYVFGGLLTQRQFTASNFDIGRLNRPDWLTNFQSQLGVEQTVYDFGATRSQVRAAAIGREMTEEQRRAAEQAVVAGVARSYHGVTLMRQALDVAGEAVKTAEEDLRRARTVRDAGMATDADLLAIEVHVAAMREQQIRRKYDLEVGLAALNEAMGLPLDTPHELTTPLTPASTGNAVTELRRPELTQVRLSADLASEQARRAKSMRLPVVSLRGMFEADRRTFVTNGGANWIFAASLRWNLFDGGRSREMEKEANHEAAAAKASERRLRSAFELEIRQAKATAMAAQERINVTEKTVAQAEETLRIIRNRYSNGLAPVTELLRAQTALADARTRRLAAVYDQRMAEIAIEAAAGNLNGASNVLK